VIVEQLTATYSFPYSTFCSVFKVTLAPEIFSNGYRVKFDIEADKAAG